MGINGSGLQTSENGYGLMRVSGSGWKLMLAPFSITPRKLIRYVRHIDKPCTEEMGVSERMWAEIRNCWQDRSENEWY